MKPELEKQPVAKDEVIINNNVQNKEGVVKTIEQWFRKAFILRNNEIYLPHDTTVPVRLKDAPNSSVEFRAKRETKTSTLNTASEFLVNTAFDTGYQAGKETTLNELILEGNNINAAVAKEYAKKIDETMMKDLDPESKKKVAKYLSELYK